MQNVSVFMGEKPGLRLFSLRGNRKNALTCAVPAWSNAQRFVRRASALAL